MGVFTVGEIVTTVFPFSNLADRKLRPCVVLARVEFGDYVVCQITSRPHTSNVAIVLKPQHLSRGFLPLTSYIRPDKLFTADPTLMKHSLGMLQSGMRDEVLQAVQRLFTSQGTGGNR